MGIPLSALEARFVRLHGSEGGYHEEPTIESADGILFVCPLCFLAAQDQHFDPNVGVRGVHSVLCWRPRVPADVSPGHGRWDLQGTGLSDVTLVAGSSSIQLIGGCAWHGYVRRGECVDDLGPDSVERARKYHHATRQRIRETAMTEQTDQGGPVDATLTDQGETKPLIDATKPPEGETDHAAGEARGDGSETQEREYRPRPEPVVAPVGFVKTMDLRVGEEGDIEQRWVSGHDANLDPVWVPIDGQ